MEDERADTDIGVDINKRAMSPLYSRPVAGYDITYIFRAYTNKEITYDEWVKRIKDWADQMKRQHRKDE